VAARKPSDRRHGGDEEIPDLNLVPIMAIMVILIPMLIYMFTFHQIRVQRVMAPRRGTGAKKANEEKKEKELNLTIVIKRNQGFALTWEQALMDGTQTSDLIKMRTFQGEQEAYCGDPSDPDAERHQGCEFVNGVCQCYDFPAFLQLSRAKKAEVQ
jgi:biopolymer transport protein ExbD